MHLQLFTVNYTKEFFPPPWGAHAPLAVHPPGYAYAALPALIASMLLLFAVLTKRVTTFLNLTTEAEQNVGEYEAHSIAETDYEIQSTCQLAFSNEQ